MADRATSLLNLAVSLSAVLLSTVAFAQASMDAVSRTHAASGPWSGAVGLTADRCLAAQASACVGGATPTDPNAPVNPTQSGQIDTDYLANASYALRHGFSLNLTETYRPGDGPGDPGLSLALARPLNKSLILITSVEVSAPLSKESHLENKTAAATLTAGLAVTRRRFSGSLMGIAGQSWYAPPAATADAALPQQDTQYGSSALASYRVIRNIALGCGATVLRLGFAGAPPLWLTEVEPLQATYTKKQFTASLAPSFTGLEPGIALPRSPSIKFQLAYGFGAG